MQSWKELPLFDGIHLEDSWILSWSKTEEGLAFQVEFSLWPNSPFYETPKANQWTCYKIGKIVFPNLISVDGLKDMEKVKPNIGPDGEKDYGSFDSFCLASDNTYSVTWEQEEILIKSAPPTVVIA